MAIRTIVKDGDPILKKVCRPVTEFNAKLATLLDDMGETMIAANGLGLAGPQVGMLRRVFVALDIYEDEDGNEVVMFTGTCEYMGTDAIAEIKFTVYKEQESFVVSSVKLNGEDMDMWGNVLVMDVFEEYQNAKNGIDTSESYTESYLEEDVSEMPPADASVSIEEVTLRSGTYRNENSKFVFTISEPYYSEENTICVNVYAGIEGDEYRHERVGVVYEPWKEIWTGYGNFEYDGENGLITGQGLSTLIYYFDDEEMDDLEVEYTYYLDSFEVTEEEKEVLNKAIEILNDKTGFDYYRHNWGGKIIDRVEDAIKLLQEISEGKFF